MGTTHFELAPEILESKFEPRCLTENIINDKFRISGGVNGDSTGSCNFLSMLIHAVDQNSKYNGAIDGAKRHQVVCVCFDVGVCKSELVLRNFVNVDLMVARRRIHKPFPSRTTKRNTQCLIAARNWVCNDACD